MDFSKYRKLIAVLVTGLTITVLRAMGLDVGQVTAFGFDLPSLETWVVDYIVTYGLPAIALWWFPMDTGGAAESESTRSEFNKRLFLFGFACVVLVTGIAGLAWWL